MIKQIKMYTVKVKPTKVKPIDHPEKQKSLGDIGLESELQQVVTLRKW